MWKIPLVEIDPEVKDTWKESLPVEIKEILEMAKSLTPAEKNEVKRQIFKLFCYSTNPRLVELVAEAECHKAGGDQAQGHVGPGGG